MRTHISPFVESLKCHYAVLRQRQNIASQFRSFRSSGCPLTNPSTPITFSITAGVVHVVSTCSSSPWPLTISEGLLSQGSCCTSLFIFSMLFREEWCESPNTPHISAARLAGSYFRPRHLITTPGVGQTS